MKKPRRRRLYKKRISRIKHLHNILYKQFRTMSRRPFLDALGLRGGLERGELVPIVVGDSHAGYLHHLLPSMFNDFGHRGIIVHGEGGELLHNHDRFQQALKLKPIDSEKLIINLGRKD